MSRYRPNRRLKLAVLFFCFWSFCAILQAGSITLTSSLTCSVTASQLSAKLIVINEGAETAHKLRAVFQNGDKVWTSDQRDRLEQNQIWRMEYQDGLEKRLFGSYPLVVKILYQDEAGYPLSTVIINPYSYAVTTESSVSGDLKDIKLARKGKCNLRVSNQRSQGLNLRVSFFTSNELTVSSAHKELFLQPSSKKTIRVLLENVTALAGSTYPLWAVMEYDSEDKHFTSLCSSKIHIQDNVSFFKDLKWVFVILFVLLLALFIWKNKKK